MRRLKNKGEEKKSKSKETTSATVSCILRSCLPAQAMLMIRGPVCCPLLMLSFFFLTPLSYVTAPRRYQVIEKTSRRRYVLDDVSHNFKPR